MYYDDNRKATSKTPFEAEKDNSYTPDASSPNPFLLSNSLVASGSGVAVVLAVGGRSRRGLKEEKLDTTSKTPLQTKLENLGGHFTKWGLYAAIAILVALVINFIIKISAFEEARTVGKIMKSVGEFFTVSIAIIVVAVPEGLPLTITLSLAYSVMRMKKDGILVRNLDSPEVMGRVDEIVTGKSGTMTTSEMKVDQFYAQSLLIRNTRKNTLFHCELFDRVIEIIQESILFNCDSRIEMSDNAYYEPVGNGTEVGLIKFL